MAGRRTRSGQSRTASARAVAIAHELHTESTVLLELYRKKENFSPEFVVDDGHLISVPLPSSSQLSAKDKLWLLYSALRQCRGLLERAIAREEEEEVGAGGTGDYGKQRKTVRDRLGYLLDAMRSLLEDMDGTAAFTPDPASIEIDGPSRGDPFKLKRWIYGIFREVEHWSDAAAVTLSALPVDGPRRRGRGRTRARRGMPN